MFDSKNMPIHEKSREVPGWNDDASQDPPTVSMWNPGPDIRNPKDWCEEQKQAPPVLTDCSKLTEGIPTFDENAKLIRRDVIGEKYESYIQATDRAKREDLHVPGAKDDSDKVQVGLMLRSFPHALWAVAEVSTYGANKKYTPFGFLKVENPDHRYFNAEARHMLKELMDEDVDEETSYLHHAHKIWNDLARLEIRMRKEKENAKKGA